LIHVVISRRKDGGFATELVFVQRDFATDRYFEGTDIVVFGLGRALGVKRMEKVQT